MIRSFTLFVVLCLVAFVGAAERDVIIYGSTPVTPQTAHLEGQLRVGVIRLSFPEENRDALSALDWRVRGILEPEWVRSNGTTVDSFNQPTSDPNRFVWTGDWVVRRVVADAEDGPITIANYAIADAPKLLASPASIGEVYWYAGENLHRIAVVDGTRFVNYEAAHIYRYMWGIEAQPISARVRGTVVGNTVHIRGASSLVMPTSAMTTPIAQIDGAWIIVPIMGTLTRQYYQEKVVHFNDPTQRDPYLLNGLVVSADPTFNQVPNMQFQYRRIAGGDWVVVQAHPTTAGTMYDLPEPWRSHEIAATTPSGPLYEVDTSHERGDLDGQDTVALEASVREAREDHEGHEDLQASVDEIGFDPETGGTVNPFASGGDIDIEALRAELDPETIANEQQALLRNIVQEAPELMDPSLAGDVDSLQDAIDQVNVAVAPHMEGGRVPPAYQAESRHASMHPAGLALPLGPGQLSPDKLGEPIPDGDNPNPARPFGLSPQGAPFYDFDGDGFLDRWYTTDPWIGAYSHLMIRWNFPNDYRLRNAPRDGHPWGAYVLDRSGNESLLFATGDHVRNRIAKRRRGTKLGVTYYGPALASFLESIAGRPQDEWHLSLRFLGTIPNLPSDEPLYEVETQTITETIMRTVMVEGEPQQFPWKTITEIIDTYVGLVDEGELDGAVWSDVSFQSRILDGEPDHPTVATIIESVISVNPDEPDHPPVQTRRYTFPAEFEIEDEDIIEDEPLVVENAWMFDYAGWDSTRPPSSSNAPWVYDRGNKFGGRFGFQLNPTGIMNTFASGQHPLLTPGGVAASDHPFIRFAVREVDALNPPEEMEFAEWKKHRAMNHRRTTGWDERTDMRSGTSNPNLSGKRYFEILDGIGWYIFKGARRDYNNESEQRDLIKEMWDWYFRQPSTVLQIQRINNRDPNSPLLNSARAPMKGDPGVTELVSSVNAAVHRETARGADSEQAAAERRARLINEQIYFFSAARGREWEVEYALQMPKTVRLVCVEWDDQRAVQRLFSRTGHMIEFTETTIDEDKIKGQVITDMLGKPQVRANMNMAEGTVGMQWYGDQSIENAARENPGTYIFAHEDLLYGQPAIHMRSVALLRDGQYGNPEPDQWRESHKAEFRHPMLVYYDDRWSSIVIAYGHNTDPVAVFGAWNENGPVTEHAGLSDADRHRQKFEAWTLEDSSRLPAIYDALHPDEFSAAQVGSVELPPAPPAPGTQPVAPVEPVLLTTQPNEPVTVPPPGDYPQAPVAPWHHMPPADSEEARFDAWMASGNQRYDHARPGYVAVIHANRAYWYNIQEAERDAHPLYGHSWSHLWFFSQGGMWGGSALYGIGPVVGRRIRPTAHDNAGNGSFVGGQHHDNHANVVFATVVNNGGAHSASLSFLTDDGGAIVWNDQVVHGSQANRTRISSGHGGVTVRSGVNQFVGLHKENGGGSSYNFSLGGVNLTTYRGPESAVIVYPFYPPRSDGLARTARDRYHNELHQYSLAVAAWEADDAAYREYLGRMDVYRQQMTAYRESVDQHATAHAQYLELMATYPHRLAAWEDRKAAYDAWQHLANSVASATQLWANYRQARDAWVLLAESEIARPGVNWSGPGTPVFEGYEWWSEHTIEGQEFP